MREENFPPKIRREVLRSVPYVLFEERPSKVDGVRRIFKTAFFTVGILSVDIGQVCSASYFFRKSTSASTPSLGMAL